MLAMGWGLPGVILNLATAYLRMMVPNPVVAKESGMKQNGMVSIISLPRQS
jgi:hypothetical protein